MSRAFSGFLYRAGLFLQGDSPIGPSENTRGLRYVGGFIYNIGAIVFIHSFPSFAFEQFLISGLVLIIMLFYIVHALGLCLSA